ncbi:HNH endonuclease [Hylemonella sp. W303a]|uniref:HNH endonuclease n=1 Tax=Hylemonella sp. W303a TaxID=3389873 RepID=UPI00396B3E70
MTFNCLYCAQKKPISESTLEHAVPKFLGGAQAPPHYKLHNVCRSCNNGLGLHVDGSYAKSWFVTNALASAARKYYSGPGQSDFLPLTCMGPVNIPGLQLPEDTVAELWLGPSGESIIWMRTDDDDLYWYTGGNPTHRKNPSTVYFMPVSGDPVRLRMGTEAVIGGFKKTKARYIFGATVGGLPPGTAYPGFDLPTVTDESNIQAIRTVIQAGSIRAQLQMNTKFDQRFICKMALAVGFALFGQTYLATVEAAEARKGLWPNPEHPPRVRGSQTIFNNPQFAHVAGYEGAVVILVMQSGGSYAMSMTVDRSLPFVVELCPATLRSEFLESANGYSLVIFPLLQQCVEICQSKLLAHTLGHNLNAELAAIDQIRQTASYFWESLPSLAVQANKT